MNPLWCMFGIEYKILHFDGEYEDSLVKKLAVLEEFLSIGIPKKEKNFDFRTVRMDFLRIIL